MQGLDLSVVVVAYDMPQQIVRTVRSLSPAMQRGIDAADYEIVVVDNGSPEPVDRAACEAFGAQIRWVDVEQPTPSPAPAANVGLREARGEMVGALIDGARMASPGMLAHALLARRLHDRPVVSTLSYHLGRQPQYVSAAAGYDEAAEAELLATVDWESDGYRLFDVAVPGHSGFHWFRRPFESNAVFMPRAMWEELGGFDEAFVQPGGGLVNPDLYARAIALPRSRPVSLLGEATFHQVHGGVSTNRVLAESPLDEWHEEYARLRGRRFSGGQAPILSVGTPAPEAAAAILRSRPGAAVGARYVRLLRQVLLDRTRATHGALDVVEKSIAAVLDDGVPGALVACGEDVAAPALMRGMLSARGVAARRTWVAAGDARAAIAEELARHDLLDDRVAVLDGPAGAALAGAPIAAVALLVIGGAASETLETLYGRVSPGGIVVASDDQVEAVEAFRARRGIDEPLVRLDGVGVQWRKVAPEREAAA